jgi:hypothetical protein
VNASVLAAAVALALVSGCGETEGPADSGDGDGWPTLSYGQDGVHSILPVGGAKVLTLGFVARNRGDEPVVIESVQAVRAVGAGVSEVGVVGRPERSARSLRTSASRPPTRATGLPAP